MSESSCCLGRIIWPFLTRPQSFVRKTLHSGTVTSFMEHLKPSKSEDTFFACSLIGLFVCQDYNIFDTPIPREIISSSMIVIKLILNHLITLSLTEHSVLAVWTHLKSCLNNKKLIQIYVPLGSQSNISVRFFHVRVFNHNRFQCYEIS